MSAEGFSTIRTRQIADLGFLNVTVRDVGTPSGETVERVVIEHPGAAAVVPLIDGDIILIEQYRAPIEERLLEIPAGKLDDQVNDPGHTAGRELEEETGYTAGHLEHLTDLLTTVGFSDEVISIYLATGLSEGVRTPIGEEEEDASIVRMPFSEAVAAVEDGRIRDAKTVAGILLAARRGSS